MEITCELMPIMLRKTNRKEINSYQIHTGSEHREHICCDILPVLLQLVAGGGQYKYLQVNWQSHSRSFAIECSNPNHGVFLSFAF